MLEGFFETLGLMLRVKILAAWELFYLFAEPLLRVVWEALPPDWAIEAGGIFAWSWGIFVAVNHWFPLAETCVLIVLYLEFWIILNTARFIHSVCPFV